MSDRDVEARRLTAHVQGLLRQQRRLLKVYLEAVGRVHPAAASQVVADVRWLLDQISEEVEDVRRQISQLMERPDY